jgi:hypothetical protein
MFQHQHVRVFKPSGQKFLLDGKPPNLQDLTTAVIKAAHGEDELNLPTLVENMNEVVKAQRMPDSFIKEHVPAERSVKKPEKVIVFEFRLEDWCNVAIIISKSDDEFVQASIGFKLNSSLFGSIKRKKERCLRDMFGVINHVYGESLNYKIRPEHENPSRLVFRDSKSMCVVMETQSGGIFSGSVRIVVTVYKRSWWDPDREEIEEFVYAS